MNDAIKNYSDAFTAHLSAQREEIVSKDKVRKTRHALLLAREDMRAMEREVLENNLLNL